MILNSQLISTFRKLDKTDQKAVCELSQCAYFNKKAEVAGLCLQLATNINKVDRKLLSKENLFHALYPGQPFDDTRLRLVMSWTLKLIERYLAFREMENSPSDRELFLLTALKKRRMEKRFEKKIKNVQSGLHASTERSAKMHQLQYTLANQQLEGISGKERSSRLELHPLHNHLTAYYLSEMLRHACSALTHAAISAQVYDMNLLDQVLRLADEFGVEKYPAIAIYYYACKALKEPENRQYFDSWKTCLHRFENQFSKQELRSIYLLGINFCIRRLNKGEQEFIREAFDLYKPAMEKDLLKENGNLTAFTFKNIIRIGAALGEDSWTDQFFQRHQKSLHPSERDDVVRYNAAFLHFRRKEYDKAMPLLQQVDLDDTLNNLDARRMLLRSYYELGEMQALDSLLHSFTTYLRRQKDLGYHRDMYLNLIRFLRQLMEVRPKDKPALKKLKEKVEVTTPVAEKDWLMTKIETKIMN